MSNLRHAAAVHVCPPLPSFVTALAVEIEDGHRIPPHVHAEDQLVYASRGVMSVEAANQIWVVPPHRAVWIPAKVPHSISMSGDVSIRTLYLRAGFVATLPRTCRVMSVSPLLRELLLHACTFKELSRRRKEQAHLIDLIVDQMKTLEAVPLQLPSPLDRRAAKVAAALTADLTGEKALDDLCSAAGASRRTIERLFESETGLSIGAWRQQLRLVRALQLLAAGESISRVALETGYSTPSAFISMFRRALGESPRRYFGGSLRMRAHSDDGQHQA
jgi:AraC-like DNA-binding protein